MSVTCPRCAKANPNEARFCNTCGADIPQPEDLSAIPVKCLKCGAMNSSALKTCGYCGIDLAESIKAAKSRPPPPPPTVKQCPSCGRQIDTEAKVCTYCGYDLLMDKFVQEGPQDPKPGYAAILMFGSGVLGIFIALYDIFYQELPIEYVQFQGIVEFCAVLIMIFAIVCIIGGYFALKRQHFILAVIGAIAGMMTGGLYVGSIMSLIALILLAISQREFEN